MKEFDMLEKTVLLEKYSLVENFLACLKSLLTGENAYLKNTASF
jgi:hypothetical protein